MKTLGIGVGAPSQQTLADLSIKKTSELPPLKKPWSYYLFLFKLYLNKNL